MGYCPGIENYSRHLSGREEGEPPDTVLSTTFPTISPFIDESHVTVPQMRRHVRRRPQPQAQTLVDYGFRLPVGAGQPTARYDEFESLRRNQVVLRVGHPGRRRAREEGGISSSSRSSAPPGLLDPSSTVRPSRGPGEDLYGEIRERAERGERVLVTTLTKRWPRTSPTTSRNVGSRSATAQRDRRPSSAWRSSTSSARAISTSSSGINLLREGSICPRCHSSAILDADKEGFLRSSTSLIQTIGRAARNVHGKVIMYADRMSEAMGPGDTGDRAPTSDPARVQRAARNHAAFDLQGRSGYSRARTASRALTGRGRG